MTHPDTPRPPMSETVKLLTPDELVRLRKCADSIPTDDEWFTLGDPWLGGGMETQVIARSPDPHVALVVCDMLDLAMAGHEDQFTDDEWSARNWANAEFIAAFDPPTVKRMLATIADLETKLAVEQETSRARYMKAAENLELYLDAKSRAEKAERDLAQSREMNVKLAAALRRFGNCDNYTLDPTTPGWAPRDEGWLSEDGRRLGVKYPWIWVTELLASLPPPPTTGSAP